MTLHGMNRMKFVPGLLLLCVTLLFAGTVHAVQVSVNTGSYSGKWAIDSIQWKNGSSTVDLGVGSHQFLVGYYGRFNVDVATDGTISTTKTDSAIASGNTLTLLNTSINIEPGAYTGSWTTEANLQHKHGAASEVLVPGLTYQFLVGLWGRFNIDVAADGTISTDKTDSAIATGNTLTLLTTTVYVDPGSYGYSNTSADISGAKWAIYLVSDFQVGPANVELVTGVRYAVQVGGYGSFYIQIDGVGNVTVENDISAIGVGGYLTFNTISIDIDPGSYGYSIPPAGIVEAPWGIYGSRLYLSGQADVELVPGLRYSIQVGHTGSFYIQIDGVGNVTVENGISANGGNRSLVFNISSIIVDPLDYTGDWYVPAVIDYATGLQSLNIVSGVRYKLTAFYTSEYFSVTDPCAVDPPLIDIGGAIFNISCGSLDTDFDGVPDENDNCPLISNPDQIDQDQDGSGNVCDLDLDGDGADNVSDNCPDISNPDQADLDGDGIGDACETDTDGDSVTNADDNCEFIVNPDQGNSDDDSLGDACDEDDDNDTIFDEFDNCKVTYNPFQEDYDGDGDGDVCDGDADGDGIENTNDVCPTTPVDQQVNIKGCSGAEFIAYNCLRENFVQHGQYVSCVAHAANEAVEQSLLTPKEKAIFVKEAAKKK